jgi:MGT family glycosyltransferase
MAPGVGARSDRQVRGAVNGAVAMRFLLVATALHGHVTPLLSIGRELVDRGHDATLLTGIEFGDVVGSAGVGFQALPPSARAAAPRVAPRRRLRVVRGRDAILDTFIRPLPAQHEALDRLLAASEWDGVLSDTAYLGSLPLLMTHRPSARPPILGVSVTPLSFVSVDCAPFGSGLQPGQSAWSRMRNRQIQWLLRHGPLRSVQRELDAALAGYGIPRKRLDYFDHAGQFDLTFQLAPAEFEYPRREQPSTVRFVGPLPPEHRPVPVPDWWPDLAQGLVIHVTQGTLDNDPRKLIAPAIRSLADAPATVVVATGGTSEQAVRDAVGGPLPANVRLAAYLPYDQLLPLTAVVVSNGGHGGVQQALRHAVPLVIAGDTEDKPEVAARVRRCGAGIQLRTGTPSPRRIRTAVQHVLHDPTYRRNATRMRDLINDLGDPRSTIADTLERAAAEHKPFR